MIGDLFFLKQAFNAINVPIGTALAASHTFKYAAFSFVLS